MTQTDIFCSSQVILPQSGQILIAGGDNWTATARRPTPATTGAIRLHRRPTCWRAPSLNRARWYSSSTALINGEVYIQGGKGGADLPEIRDSTGGVASAVEREHRRILRHVSAQFPRARRPRVRLRHQRQHVFRHTGRGRFDDACGPVARRNAAGPRAPRCSRPDASCRWAATRVSRWSSTSMAHSRS